MSALISIMFLQNLQKLFKIKVVGAQFGAHCSLETNFYKIEYKLYGKKIAVIGLGYVELPLAIEFGKKYKVLGFDINKDRIEELKNTKDRTNEADLEGLRFAMNLAN